MDHGQLPLLRGSVIWILYILCESYIDWNREHTFIEENDCCNIMDGVLLLVIVKALTNKRLSFLSRS